MSPQVQMLIRKPHRVQLLALRLHRLLHLLAKRLEYLAIVRLALRGDAETVDHVRTPRIRCPSAMAYRAPGLISVISSSWPR
jgi:hypothetical protein